jgi:signal transduction histidine kinase
MHSKAIFLSALVLLSVHLPIYGQDETEVSYFEGFFATGDQPPLEEALYSASLKLEQAREIMDGSKTASALRNLGLLHLNRVHDYEKAMDFFVQALAIEDSLNLESQRALTLVAISRVFEVVGDYYKSAQFLGHALKLNQAERDINSQATILINLGKVNASMGNLDEALRNYEQVLKYRVDIDRKFEAEALSNLAHVFSIQGNYSRALDHHKKALRITRAVKDRYAEALSLNNIGVLYEMMKNEEKSLANHQVALEIRQALKDQRGIAQSYNHIGWWYHRHNDPDKAITIGKLALENGLASQAQEQIFKSYELLSQSYKGLGDYKNGLHYKELSLAIHEFMQNEKHERQLLETQNRYVLEKKETEIEKLDALRLEREKEIAAQKKFRNILFLLVGMVLIIALLVLYLYLVKRRSNRVLEVAKNEVQKQNVRLQQLNHTKDKFFSIISHDLKGPLNSLTSFSHLLIEHTDSMSKEEIQLLARDLDKSVKNLYTLLENLLEWSRSQTGNIDFTGEVFDLSELLKSNKSLLESQARHKNIRITLTAAACHVKLHKPSINTVLRNLISNAIKFTPEGGSIGVTLQTSDKGISVAVSDNGVGMSAEVVAKLFRIDTKHSTKGTANERGTGLGLILCREFIEKNGGTLSVSSESGKGSVFTFSFPARSVHAPIEVAEPASF